jgi:cytochrome b pre-mRNA-processing protein 3
MPISFLDRLLTPKAPPLSGLWNRIVAEARKPHWYLRHAVPDSVDGRFDLVVAVAALVFLRLEAADLRQEVVWLTERFVDDMDGSLREIGIGDQAIGKQVGRMVGALGGRLGAYREALAAADPARALAAALERNVYRGADTSLAAPDLAADLLRLSERIGAVPLPRLLGGNF